jgi:hypothetical protein
MANFDTGSKAISRATIGWLERAKSRRHDYHRNVWHLIVLPSGLQQKSDLNEKWQDSRFQEIDEEAAL